MSASGGTDFRNSIRSLFLPLPANCPAEVADGRLGVAGELAGLFEERPERPGGGARGVDERIEVVEGGAQVDEGRVGPAHERRQALDRLGERGLLVAERARGRVEVPDQPGEVVAPVGEGRDELGGVDEEALEDRRVAGQLVEEPARGGEGGVQVLEADLGLVAAVAELVGLVRGRSPGATCGSSGRAC